MNGSGEFQDIESNYSGRLSQVSRQPEMLPSSRSLLSRDERLPLDTWNQSGVQEKFSEIDFLRLIHLEMFLKEFHLNTCAEIEKLFWRHKSEDKSDKWRQTKLWHNSNADFYVESDDYQFYNTGGITAELCGRTAETADVGITNSTNSIFLHHSWCGGPDSKHRYPMVLIFHRKLCDGSKKWRWLTLWTS